MPTVGYGVGGAVGVGTEVTPGVGVVPTKWIPFLSESIKGQRALVEQGTITGDRSVRKRLSGVRQAAGDVAIEIDGDNFGQLFNYWNGNASGAYTPANVAGFVAAAPGGAVVAGGTIPVGTYRYKVATIWSGPGGKLQVVPASAELSGVATTSGNQQVNLTWVVAGTPPAGFTVAGTAIYRSPAGGAAGSEIFLHCLLGSGLSYSDTGALTPDANIVPIQGLGTLREHKWERAFTPGSNPLQSFSTTVVKDNDASERFNLCRMNTFELTVGEGNSPVNSKFGLLARDFEKITPNPTPTLSNINKFVSWQTQVAVNGTYQDIIEAVTVQGNNNCELIPGLSGEPRMREVGYGRRQVTGTMSRGFETHEFWDLMRDGMACGSGQFDLRLAAQGGPISTTVAPIKHCFDDGTGNEVEPFTYTLIIDVFSCMLSEAGSNISGPGRMVEQIQFGAQVNETEGTELRVRLYNFTSTYA